MPNPATATVERFERKRQEILAAAREVFTREGYMGTSMDAVAAEASASKRTVYQYFADKEELFAATVLETVDRGFEYFQPRILELARTTDIDEGIRNHARATVVGLTSPELLKMRRLVIAEAERFPQLGREYYERSWVRTLKLFAQTLQTLSDRGLLSVPDPDRAAYLFTWLVVSIPANRAAFLGDAAVGTEAELIAHADEGARVFLAAFAAPAGETGASGRGSEADPA